MSPLSSLESLPPLHPTRPASPAAPKPVTVQRAENTVDDRARRPRSIAFQGDAQPFEDRTQPGLAESVGSQEARGFEDLPITLTTERDATTDIRQPAPPIAGRPVGGPAAVVRLSAAGEDDVFDSPTDTFALLNTPRGTEPVVSRPRADVTAISVCMVADDPQVRRQLRADLAPMVEAVEDFATLPEALKRALVQDFTVAVVYGPKNDVRTGQLLERIGRCDALPIVVFSADPDFDGLAGVTMRVSPPRDVSAVAGVLLSVLRVVQRPRPRQA